MLSFVHAYTLVHMFACSLRCVVFCTLCSAGVGRTGVLIAVETAMNTMEVLEPINLMEIVRKMRDQRGMMVQSSVSTFCP